MGALGQHRRFAALGPLAVSLVLVLAFGKRTSEARSLKQDQPLLRGAPRDLAARWGQAGCANASLLSQWHPYRPAYHITVPYGWLNDPHGLLEHQGLHHLFFQYNPRATAWGPPFWGHVVSRDLVHWQWLPPALLPDSQQDFSGVWSGAVTVTEDGTPWLSYTAAGTQVPELGNFFQTQGVAVPANRSDPLLRAWTKSRANPVLSQTPPGGTSMQFRDTTPANRDVRAAVARALSRRSGGSGGSGGRRGGPDGAAGGAPRFAWALGAQAFCLGTAAIYAADSMEGPWEFAGTLFNQLAVDPGVNGRCEAASNASNPAFGGPCNQFGTHCRMWEVVDFAEVAPGIWAVKWSDQAAGRDPFSAEFYVLSDELDPAALGAGRGGRYSAAIDSAEESALRTLLTGRLGGRPFSPVRLDYGSTYASKFERLKNGTLVLNTWVYDTFKGCINSCSEHTAEGDEYVRRAPFKGVLQLPRRVTYNSETRTLVVFPIDALKSLRRARVFVLPSPQALAPAAPQNSAALLQLLPAKKGSGAGGEAAAAAAQSRQFHARVVFTVEPGSGGAAAAPGAALNFTAGLRLVTGEGSHVDLGLEGAAVLPPPATAAGGGGGNATGGPAPAAELTALRVFVDKRATGGFTPQAVDGGPVPLPVALGSGTNATRQPGTSGSSGGGGGGAPAPWRLPSKPLALDVWVDHGLLEVYALGGLARVTARIYPPDERAPWGLSAFGGAEGPAAGRVVQSEAEVWALDGAWAGQKPSLC